MMHAPSSDSEEYDQYESGLIPNPALTLVEHPGINPLRSVLSESLPYCSGTLQLPAESFVLYYGEDERACRINLLGASISSLDALEKSCDPATFGVDQKDVLDVSYRKAGKLDKNRFSINLDVARVGLLDAVRTGLFTGKDEKQSLCAELYKLNVYGKDSFFKSHRDTPRGATMFGSLVLVFPTPHEGGTLVLRHESHEWTFDAARVIATLPHAAARIAYIALFSDVEHEVKRVTSGHRVTITYNLYFAEEAAQMSPPRGLTVIHPRGANEPEVKTTLTALLDEPTFLPEGGTLGFGLRHLYPLPSSFDPYDDNTLESLKNHLKGIDAALFQALAELCLKPSLYTIFEAHDDADDGRRTLVACPRVVTFHTHDYDDEEALWEKLCLHFDGVLVNSPPPPGQERGCCDADRRIERRVVHWVTPLSEVNRVKTRFAAYGNEPEMGYPCLSILLESGTASRRCLILLSKGVMESPSVTNWALINALRIVLK